MATSGTVATTVIDTSAVIEHAFRRCRIPPVSQTPETILIAKENLYMLLLNLGNRGLNLWAVEKVFQGVVAGQATYTTAPGTLDVLNVLYSQPKIETSVFATTVSGGTATLSAATTITRVGVTFGAPYTGALALSSSLDGVTYTTCLSVPSASYTTGVKYWFELPVAASAGYFAVDNPAVAPALADITLASTCYDLPCSQWNRDTYAAINSKTQQGRPATNYFFEKKLTPTITLWPVPNNGDDYLTLFRHRQPQDVGTLTQQLEIPQRWLDGIIWLLAARLCFELPGVDVSLGQMIVQMADKQTFEAEMGETDGAPLYLTPGIGVYSR